MKRVFRITPLVALALAIGLTGCGNSSSGGMSGSDESSAGLSSEDREA
jgi:hypothetical protein